MFGLADHWVWMILAAGLATLEMLAPGFFLIWIGGAALITGLAALMGLPVAGQFILFGVTAIGMVVIGRRYVIADDIASADPLLNDRAGRMIGSVATAIEPIDADQGRVKLGDSEWPARGANAAIGMRVRVTSIESGTLIVELA